MMFSRVYSRACVTLLGRLIGSEPDALEARLDQLRVSEPYQSFSLPKGRGGQRLIESPHPTLKRLQRALLDGLFYRASFAYDCHGFVPGRSIVSHARLHCRQQSLVNYDIADAFPSVSRRRVRVSLERRLGHVLKHRAPRATRPEREELLELLSDLCTWQDRLPQGAPTSGALLNFALAPLDRKLRKACRAWQEQGLGGMVYSRYADDLTLSSRGALPADVDAVMRKAILQAGFRFHPAKVHRARRAKGQALRICGIDVDGDRLRLPRKTLKRYRAVLHHAFCADSLSDSERGKLYGISGLVQMVYQGWPAALDGPWQLLQARHDLGGLPEPHTTSPSGY